MKQSMTKKHLIARDQEDLTVLSALMQDAVVTPRDMAMDKPAKRFAIAARRYRWENGKKLFRPKGERIASVLQFDQVLAVQSRNMPEDRDAPLALLSLQTTETEKDVTIKLIFAGNISVRLICDSIDVLLTDQGEAWDATRRPLHDS